MGPPKSQGTLTTEEGAVVGVIIDGGLFSYDNTRIADSPPSQLPITIGTDRRIPDLIIPRVWSCIRKNPGKFSQQKNIYTRNPEKFVRNKKNVKRDPE